MESFYCGIISDCQEWGQLSLAVQDIIHPNAEPTIPMLKVAFRHRGLPQSFAQMMEYTPHMMELAKQMGTRPPGVNSTDVPPDVMRQYLILKGNEWLNNATSPTQSPQPFEMHQKIPQSSLFQQEALPAPITPETAFTNNLNRRRNMPQEDPALQRLRELQFLQALFNMNNPPEGGQASGTQGQVPPLIRRMQDLRREMTDYLTENPLFALSMSSPGLQSNPNFKDMMTYKMMMDMELSPQQMFAMNHLLQLSQKK